MPTCRCGNYTRVEGFACDDCKRRNIEEGGGFKGCLKFVGIALIIIFIVYLIASC